MGNLAELALDEVREAKRQATYRTLDEPILIFDRLTLAEVGVALGATVLGGALLGEWTLTLAIDLAAVVVLPRLRRRFPRGTWARMASTRFSRLPVGPLTWGRLKWRDSL